MKYLAVLVLSIFSFALFAQDINEAGAVFNEGNQANKDGNFTLAIQKYEKSIEIASKLGEEGAQIVAGSKAQIPQLYFKVATEDYTAGNIEKAISEYENAIKYGTEYNDPETVSKSKDNIPKLLYARGNDLYKEKKYPEALASFQRSYELNPGYSRSLFGMGLTYNKMGDLVKMEETFDKGIVAAEAEKDDKMVEKIKQTAKKFIQAEGASKLQAKDYNAALKNLNASMKYDDKDSETYYYLGLTNNGLKKYDDAIVSLDKGLELSAAENDEFKAKFYFELGNAYKGKGMNDKACESFGKAKFGRFVQNADYEIKTVLKCK